MFIKMMKKKKVLLTGASGTVGREVLKQLVDSDANDIVIFDRFSRPSKQFFEKYASKITVRFGDISHEQDLVKACTDVDYVIHLAGVIPPVADEKPALAKQVNEEGTKLLIQSLEKHSPNAFFIYASSISVYGDRLASPFIKVGDPLQASEGDYYAETKMAAEALLQKSSLAWTIFRLTAIMGNHKISPLMFHMPLDTKMELCTPEDTARAFVHALHYQKQLHGRIFNLGGGEKCRLSYRQLLSRSFAIFGLGKVDFPPKAFAEKNFHCGYYLDGDELEEILHFRKDDLASYFSSVKQKASPFTVAVTKLLQPIIKKRLLRHSEPLKAYKENDTALTNRFFN